MKKNPDLVWTEEDSPPVSPVTWCHILLPIVRFPPFQLVWTVGYQPAAGGSTWPFSEVRQSSDLRARSLFVKIPPRASP
jgi:hypothetical protein